MRWLITGGAGFIGSNAAHRLSELGHDVVVFDNLSRSGTAINLRWLQDHASVEFIEGDVRDYASLSSVLKGPSRIDVVLHLAGQVAVTTSIADPRHDFEVNAGGTFNVCEAVRCHSPESILLNASTNKVYGNLASLRTEKAGQRYRFAEGISGVTEDQPVDYHSPYGCSKGVADAYVHDYARIYGLRTVNFRQSCIYGRRQFGIEDQGWVAWFAIAATLERPITIFGDGMQARDLLFVDDLVECYLAAVQNIEAAAGESFNIGGGPENTLSLLELIHLLERRLGRPLKLTYSDWRSGDQPLFVCDVAKARRLLRWQPTTSAQTGVEILLDWIEANREVIERVLSPTA